MTYNFKQYRKGTTFSGVQFALKINSQPTDLSDVIIKMEIGNRVLSTTTGEFIYIDETQGIFQLKKQVLSLPIGTLKYKIRFLYPNGDNKIYLTGTWQIIL